MRRYTIFLLASLAWLFSSVSHASDTAHSDITLAVREQRLIIENFDRVRDVAGFPVVAVAFESALTPYLTQDPGFNGRFPQGDLVIGYRIASALRKWDVSQQVWLEGGFDERLLLSKSGVTTIVSATEGQDARGLVGAVGSTRELHSHVTFQMAKLSGLPDDGAYLLVLMLSATDKDGSTPRYTPSAPFVLALHVNATGRFDEAAFDNALARYAASYLPPFAPARIDALFDWAEAQYVELFPHRAMSRGLFGYHARCYDNGLCLGARDDGVYLSGGVFGARFEVGRLRDYLRASGL